MKHFFCGIKVYLHPTTPPPPPPRAPSVLIILWTTIVYSRTCLEKPLATKMWSPKKGGLRWETHVCWNVRLSGKNVCSFKTGGLSWQWSLKTRFTVLYMYLQTPTKTATEKVKFFYLLWRLSTKIFQQCLVFNAWQKSLMSKSLMVKDSNSYLISELVNSETLKCQRV